MNFGKWLKIDESQIDALYDKAKISVELVQMFNPKLLTNISTIANLAAGAYGIYQTAENKNLINPNEEQRIIIKTNHHLTKQQIEHLPPETLKNYFGVSQITPNDIIHVNVKKILAETHSDIEAIIQIAATIAHEATHEMEYREKRQTNETAPTNIQKALIKWAMQPNIQSYIAQRLKSFTT